MLHRPIFVTNSSSSCLIVWNKAESVEEMSDEFIQFIRNQGAPDIRELDMTIIKEGACPCCHRPHGETKELYPYLEEEEYQEYISDKLKEGYTIFYTTSYLGCLGHVKRGTETLEGGAIERQGPGWAWG
jgi:hypothetical protein